MLNACRRQRNLHATGCGRLHSGVECSTPVGVKGISTSFRAIRGVYHSACAQRLSASKESPPRRPGRIRQALAVLNACRRQRNLHFDMRGLNFINGMECSTPVGVKGISTSIGGRTSTAEPVLNACRRQRNLHAATLPAGSSGSSAQRLSASKESPPARRAVGSICRGCSTPVGVKGISTIGSGCSPRTSIAVLNACRRQRNLHPSSRAARRGLVRAQRLSASKESPPPSIPARSSLGPSAQRLSASKESPRPRRAQRRPPGWRAQRLSASKESPRRRRRKSVTLATVLNACRRQRNLHRPALPRRRYPMPVLNACRRQRNLHQHAGHRQRAMLSSCAQRLSASKESPLHHLYVHNSNGVKLRAFKHVQRQALRHSRGREQISQFHAGVAEICGKLDPRVAITYCHVDLAATNPCDQKTFAKGNAATNSTTPRSVSLLSHDLKARRSGRP